MKRPIIVAQDCTSFGCFTMVIIVLVCAFCIGSTLERNSEIGIQDAKWLKSWVDTYPQDLLPIWNKSLKDGKIIGSERRQIEALIYQTKEKHKYD